MANIFDKAKNFATNIIAPGSSGGVGAIPGFDQILSSSEIKSMIPGLGDAMAAEQANKLAIAQAQKQMDFQERMSNSAYQRAMDDMKKAGLNPMLAFSQGGAAVPAGAAAPIQTASKTKLGEFALNSALGVNAQAQQQQTIDSQVRQTEANIDLSKTSAAKQIAETQRTQVETAKAKKDLPAAQLQGDLAKEGSTLVRRLLDSVKSSAKTFSADEWKKVLKKNPEPVKAPQKPNHFMY